MDLNKGNVVEGPLELLLKPMHLGLKEELTRAVLTVKVP
jgi:hypothetical protein